MVCFELWQTIIAIVYYNIFFYFFSGFVDYVDPDDTIPNKLDKKLQEVRGNIVKSAVDWLSSLDDIDFGDSNDLATKIEELKVHITRLNEVCIDVSPCFMGFVFAKNKMLCSMNKKL